MVEIALPFRLVSETIEGAVTAGFRKFETALTLWNESSAKVLVIQLIGADDLITHPLLRKI
jgi:hypothetical protein